MKNSTFILFALFLFACEKSAEVPELFNQINFDGKIIDVETVVISMEQFEKSPLNFDIQIFDVVFSESEYEVIANDGNSDLIQKFNGSSWLYFSFDFFDYGFDTDLKNKLCEDLKWYSEVKFNQQFDAEAMKWGSEFTFKNGSFCITKINSNVEFTFECYEGDNVISGHYMGNVIEFYNIN